MYDAAFDLSVRERSVEETVICGVETINENRN
jgi:hypothetical protein